MEIWYDERGYTKTGAPLRLQLACWGDAHAGAVVIVWGLTTLSGWAAGEVKHEIIQPNVPKTAAIRMAIARFDELVKK